MPVRPTEPPSCQICGLQPSKYRCPTCPVRYCSVPCFKLHKASTCEPSASQAGPSNPSVAADSSTTAHTESTGVETNDDNSKSWDRDDHARPLKPLTDLLWPPEPDSTIFSDPLRRDDPKPLRHEELLRIATSPQLRHLLTATSLPHILRILDAIPSPQARSSSLSRLLGLDPESLAKPGADSLLSQRGSPPPLGDLLAALTGGNEQEIKTWDEKGWWLGREGTKEGRIWIGEEEKRILRLFAGVVCQAIEGTQGDEVAWGQGGLAWEV